MVLIAAVNSMQPGIAAPSTPEVPSQPFCHQCRVWLRSFALESSSVRHVRARGSERSVKHEAKSEMIWTQVPAGEIKWTFCGLECTSYGAVDDISSGFSILEYCMEQSDGRRWSICMSRHELEKLTITKRGH